MSIGRARQEQARQILCTDTRKRLPLISWIRIRISPGEPVGSKPCCLPGSGQAETFEYDIARPESRAQRSAARQAERDHDKALRTAERRLGSLHCVAATMVLEHGEVRTRELTEAGVHRPMIAPMCSEGILIRVRYGIYGPGPKARDFVVGTVGSTLPAIAA